MISNYFVLALCEPFGTWLVCGSSLLRFIQSNSGPLLTGFFTLVAAFIGAAGAIFGIWLLLRYYKGKEEREKISLLKAAYNALISEIETNKEYLEKGLGKALDEVKGPLLARGAFDWEHDIMYKANAQIICYIPDSELTKAIVRLYGILGALKDAARKHKAEVERRIDIEMSTQKADVKNYQLQQIDNSINNLTKMMQSCYKECERQAAVVLPKLNNQIVIQ